MYCDNCSCADCALIRKLQGHEAKLFEPAPAVMPGQTCILIGYRHRARGGTPLTPASYWALASDEREAYEAVPVL